MARRLEFFWLTFSFFPFLYLSLGGGASESELEPELESSGSELEGSVSSFSSLSFLAFLVLPTDFDALGPRTFFPPVFFTELSLVCVFRPCLYFFSFLFFDLVGAASVCVPTDLELAFELLSLNELAKSSLAGGDRAMLSSVLKQ